MCSEMGIWWFNPAGYSTVGDFAELAARLHIEVAAPQERHRNHPILLGIGEWMYHKEFDASSTVGSWYCT